METFIFTKHNSICHDLCDEIITKFNDEPNKMDVITIGGIQKVDKDTTDFIMPINCEKWYKIHKCLLKELNKNIKQYLDSLCHDEYNLSSQKSKHDFEIIDKKNIITYNFMVQRYIKNKEIYIYRNDFDINFEKKEYRIITYVWYLNNVEEGGETCFWNDYKIKPEKGKLILFPANWSFPHYEKMPISSNKYIITGWIYYKY